MTFELKNYIEITQEEFHSIPQEKRKLFRDKKAILVVPVKDGDYYCGCRYYKAKKFKTYSIQTMCQLKEIF